MDTIEKTNTILNITNTKIDTLGQYLATIRIIKRYSQAHLANLAGVSQGTIAHVESGRKDPSMRTYFKICKALDIHPAAPLRETI